jgi:conjugative relaxase-like TrwC/TraI family protein
MLRITPQKSASGAKSYFAHSDYYSDGQELVGQWGGKGAVMLGLFGEVDKHAFERLCDNQRPDGQGPLTALTRGNRRVGYDLTWSAPKSVSLVHALTGDERITDAFRASINDTMHEMEADMQSRVRGGGRQEDRDTGNLLWAEFVHLTSRPVGGVPTPQLHAHCFTINATFDRHEGRWKAGQFGKIKGDAYYWQAVQQARFARSLQTLGYAVRPTKDAFEIDGIADATVRKFSKRTALIERVAAELGITDPKRKGELGATTREKKAQAVPYSRLVEHWQTELEEGERDALQRVAAHDAPAPETDDAHHVQHAVDHGFERASVQDERRLLTAALRHGIGRVTPQGVRDAFGKLDLLKRTEGNQTWTTTRQVLAEERRVIAFAANGKLSCRPLVAEDKVHWHDERLSNEQRNAVRHVITSPDRVTLLRGVAGTGKTTLTREAVTQIEAAGKRVAMLAPSAEASRGVLRDEGFADADTLARFLIDDKMQQEARGGVIWLDEASLVGSGTMDRLFKVADQLDARVVLAGDKRQLASVERGAPLRVLEDLAGLPVAEVTDIRRQSGKYKQAVTALSRGDAAGGLHTLDGLGWIKDMPDDNPYQQLADEYAAATGKGQSALIVCATHAEGAKVTQAVRDTLRKAGRIDGKEHEVQRLVPLHWTAAERADPARYAGDEVVQFQRNAGRFKAGERVAASDVLPHLTPKLAGCFATYGRDTLFVSQGDAVRVTANGKTADGTHRLNNGAIYFVAGFDRAGNMKLNNGWTVDTHFGHLASGFVMTDFASQGRTVDRVLIAAPAATFPAGSREGFYVAASRGRKSATIYTDDKAGLLDVAAKQRPRPAAIELLESKQRPDPLHPVKAMFDRLRTTAQLAAKHAAQLRENQREPELAHAR